ncbi:hypothetical protein BBD41_06105 [Paenibacillus ihbetae]|uniref:Uncharacterized protein n=1 Tax=Paenibacillus ihbetae TaxID=1870820 RepID=A0A1B2DWU3_9BACL|nr:hypothetical protein [Paenibacillus ihbetae]ANY72196.1 hypothetical protein BBD41_06105 [Paenibacillus ihbetae]
MRWLIENYYIVVVIGFFIITALGKRGKNAGEKGQPRMPSFGGDGHRQGRQQQPELRRTQAGRPQPFPQAERHAPVQQSAGSDFNDEEDLNTGNGYSLEHEELNRPPRFQEMERKPDSMDRRMAMMESDLDRIHAQLNRMTVDIPETVVELAEEDHGPERRSHSNVAEQARNGIVWSEILGPPRSRRPSNVRR